MTKIRLTCRWHGRSKARLLAVIGVRSIQHVVILTSAALLAALPAQASFQLDGNQLLARCLQEHASRPQHQFCQGYISGVVHMAESAGTLCKVSNSHEIEQLVEVIRESLELNYQYRSSPAEGWVVNSVKIQFCD